MCVCVCLCAWMGVLDCLCLVCEKQRNKKKQSKKKKKKGLLSPPTNPLAVNIPSRLALLAEARASLPFASLSSTRRGSSFSRSGATSLLPLLFCSTSPSSSSSSSFWLLLACCWCFCLFALGGWFPFVLLFTLLLSSFLLLGCSWCPLLASSPSSFSWPGAALSPRFFFRSTFGTNRNMATAAMDNTFSSRPPFSLTLVFCLSFSVCKEDSAQRQGKKK